MLFATVRDARLNLSKLIKLAERGQEIVIRNRHRPVAKLVPYVEEHRESFPDLSELRRSLTKRGRKPTPSEELVRQDRDGR